MGRRRKCRFVDGVPEVTVFKPQGVPMGQLYGVVLGLDGFEAFRLVDGEGLSQEEAASRMQVSRPTLCRILAEARSQVARALSKGWVIRIEVDDAPAVPGRGEGESMARHCRRGRGCAGNDGRNTGGRTCRDDQDRVGEGRMDAGGEVRAADVVGVAVPGRRS